MIQWERWLQLHMRMEEIAISVLSLVIISSFVIILDLSYDVSGTGTNAAYMEDTKKLVFGLSNATDEYTHKSVSRVSPLYLNYRLEHTSVYTSKACFIFSTFNDVSSLPHLSLSDGI